MTKAQTFSRAFNATAGAILFYFGLFLLFANLNDVAARLDNSFSSKAGSVSTVIELGLAGMRAVHSYFFDQPTFQADVHLILVSFWPLIPVIIGAVLLQVAFKGRFALRGTDSGSSESEIAHE